MVPIVTRRPWGLAVLILNILLPSSGTFLAAGNQENLRYMVYGILQVLTLPLLGAGWIWSIVTGILVYVHSEPAVDVAQAESTAAA